MDTNLDILTLKRDKLIKKLLKSQKEYITLLEGELVKESGDKKYIRSKETHEKIQEINWRVKNGQLKLDFLNIKLDNKIVRNEK